MSFYLTSSSNQTDKHPGDSFNWLLNQVMHSQNQSSPSLLASNYQELQDIKQIDQPLSISELKNFTPLQDTLRLAFHLNRQQLVDHLDKIRQILKEVHFYTNYLMFPINSANTDQTNLEILFIIPTDHLLTQTEHDYFIHNGLIPKIMHRLANAFPDFEAIELSQFNRQIKPTYLSHPNTYLERNQKDNRFIIDPKTLKAINQNPKKKPTQRELNKADSLKKIQYSDQKLMERLNDFIQEPATKKILQTPDKLQLMLRALANDFWTHSYPKNFAQQVIEKLAQLKVKTKDELKLIYRSQLAQLKNSPNERLETQSFGEYLQIYKIDHNNHQQSLAMQMIATFGPNFEHSHDIELSDAINKIAEIYPPHLIRTSGPDRKNVVIFNPLKGIWEHDENELQALLNAIRDASSVNDFDTMLRALGAQARNQNAFIEPYNRSQHLLFKNGVLDRSNMTWHSLNEAYVRDLHFTERCRLNINYDPNVTTPPVFKKQNIDETLDWNPENYIASYAAFDPEKTKLLYFLLSLGLFGGHNSRVNVSFQGLSGWGKSTLFEIYRALYSKTFNDNFSMLNEQFGMTSYHPQTSIAWFNECNIGVEPLNDSYGTTRYDNFADVSLHIQVKHDGDLEIDNPPQVYVDGTSFIPVREIATGPGRRTLVFKFPNIDQDIDKNKLEQIRLRGQATDINQKLHNEKVLQYLVNQMIKAFNTELHLDQTNSKRLNNLEINLSDLKQLPKIEQTWRNEMVSSQGDVGSWYKDEFEDYLSRTNDIGQATLMHDDLAYMLYRKSYLVRNAITDKFGNRIIGKERFSRQLHTLYENTNWSVKYNRGKDGKPKRRLISSLAKTHFNFSQFSTDKNDLPEELNDRKNNGQLPYPFGKRDRGWYELIKVELKNQNN